jgi:hypothetical protein
MKLEPDSSVGIVSGYGLDELHATEAQGERKYSSYSFSNSALDGGEWSASRPGRSLPRGKDPPVPIVQEAGWAPEPVWTQTLEEKSFAPSGDRLRYLMVRTKQRVVAKSTVFIWLWRRLCGEGVGVSRAVGIDHLRFIKFLEQLIDCQFLKKDSTPWSRPVLGNTQPPPQCVPGVLFPGVKGGTLTTHPIQCRGIEWVGAIHLLAPCATMVWSGTSLPFLLLHGVKRVESCEISSSHGGEYDVQSCLLGCTAV